MPGDSVRNIVVVGGERHWHELFPEWHVIYCRLQSAQWLLRDGVLWIGSEGSLKPVHAVLWRVGVVKPESWHRAVLDLIRLAKVPCLNPADSLLRGWDKLSMQAEMVKAGLPVIASTIAIGPEAFRLIEPDLPSVIKVGNHHGGLGKARAQTREQWKDLLDMAALADDYTIVEPFIDYVSDVRCLAVAGDVWCMRRDNPDWKVNRGSVAPQRIDPPDELVAWTLAAARHLGSVVVGLDFLQAKDGTWHLLECNDVPGLTGFPDAVHLAVAAALETMAAQQ